MRRYFLSLDRGIAEEGFSWTVSAGESYEYPFTCTVVSVGIAQQDKYRRDIAKVKVDCEPNKFGRYPSLGLIPDEPRFKPFLDQYSKMKFRYSHSGEILVDLATGLLLSHRYSNVAESRELGSTEVSVISCYYASRLVVEV